MVDSIRRLLAAGGTALALAALAMFAAPQAHAALITRNVGVTLSAAALESYDLDVDLDGSIDFTFTAAFVPDPALTVGFDVVDFPFTSGNGVVIDAFTGDGFPTASRLRAGDTVSAADLFASASFDQGNLFFFIQDDTRSGNFDGRSGFIGLRFDGAGGTLFGFAQVSVNALEDPVAPFDLTIGLVGYVDVAGDAATIPAVPAPGTLALVVGGLVMLAGARRR